MSPARSISFLLRSAAMLAAMLAIPAAAAMAQAPFDRVPDELVGIEIIEHLDEKLPLDLTFTDDRGRSVTLGEYFTGEKPVLLALVYYRCPSLCNIQLNGLVEGLKGLEWRAGEEFEVVLVTINPEETWEIASAKKDSYMLAYDRAGGERGWHFNVATKANSEALAEAVGFKYRFDSETGEYVHAAATFACTPDGRLSRYLYGTYYPPKDLKLALVEAAEGKVGSAFDRFLLWCHRYDPDKGYVRNAMALMKLAGGLTLATMAIGWFVLWRIGPRHQVSGRDASPLRPSPAGAHS